jgi:hypothetical protein
VTQLQTRLQQLQNAVGVTPVDQVLLLVRLAARPANVFDPYALVGALENALLLFCQIDNLHVRLIFDLGKKSKFP